VQESVIHTLFLGAGKEFVSLHISIIINHQANVLHRSSAIVWHPNLIELLERIRSRKGLLVKLYSTFGNPEVLFFLLLSIFGNRLSAEHSQWHLELLDCRFVGLKANVRPSNEAEKIWADFERFTEFKAVDSFISVRFCK
jgi:hypothetical protein